MNILRSLTAVSILIFFSSAPFVINAGPVEDLKEAQKEFMTAKNEEERAISRLDQAQHQVRVAAEDLPLKTQSDLRRELEHRLKRLMDERKRLAGAYAEALALPAALADEYRATRRAYDEALPIYLAIGKTQNLARYPEWTAIQRRASELESQRIIARQKADEQAAEIVPQLDQNAREIRRLATELNNTVELPSEGREFDAYYRASSIFDQRTSEVVEAGRISLAAFDNYAARFGTNQPVFLEAVDVSIGAHTIYNGVWRQSSDPENKNEISGRHQRIQEILGSTRLVLDQIEQERAELRSERYKLASTMRPLNRKLSELAEDQRWSAYKRIAFTAAAEAVGTIIETFLTGGASVALRKSEELAAGAIERVAANQLHKNVIRAGEQEVLDVAARTFGSQQKYLSGAVAQSFEELEKLAIDTATANALKQGTSVTQAVIDARRRVARAFETIKTSNPEALHLAQEAVHERLHIQGEAFVEAVGSKAAAETIIHTKGGELLHSLHLSPVADDVVHVGAARMLELGFATGVRIVAHAKNPLATASAKVEREFASRLVRSGTIGNSRIKPKFLKDALKGSGRANLIHLATTTAMVIITAHYSAQEQAANEEFWKTYSELDTIQNVINILREVDQIHDKETKILFQQYSEISAYLNYLDDSRVLDVHEYEPPAVDDTSFVTVELMFSSAIDKPPIAHLTDDPLIFSTGNAPTALWTATVNRLDLPETVTLQVALQQRTNPFDFLDSNPETPVRLNPDSEFSLLATEPQHWVNLEVGTDRNHFISRNLYSADGNLTGFWERCFKDTCSTIALAQNGSKITGTLVIPSKRQKDIYGYLPGDWSVRLETRRDGSLNGVMHTRYPVEYRDKCPEQWDNTATIVLTLKGDNLLEGEWDSQTINSDCLVSEESEKILITLQRLLGKKSSSPPEESQSINLSGIWDTYVRNKTEREESYIRMTIEIHAADGHVVGSYIRPDINTKGVIDGYFLNNVFEGKWGNVSKTNTGKLKLKFDDIGNSFEGVWGPDSGEPTHPWRGDKVK